jgi:hypothetical protein
MSYIGYFVMKRHVIDFRGVDGLLSVFGMLECLYVFGEDLLEEAVVEEERLLVAFL